MNILLTKRPVFELHCDMKMFEQLFGKDPRLQKVWKNEGFRGAWQLYNPKISKISVSSLKQKLEQYGYTRLFSDLGFVSNPNPIEKQSAKKSPHPPDPVKELLRTEMYVLISKHEEFRDMLNYWLNENIENMMQFIIFHLDGIYLEHWKFIRHLNDWDHTVEGLYTMINRVDIEFDRQTLEEFMKIFWNCHFHDFDEYRILNVLLPSHVEEIKYTNLNPYDFMDPFPGCHSQIGTLRNTTKQKMRNANSIEEIQNIYEQFLEDLSVLESNLIPV